MSDRRSGITPFMHHDARQSAAHARRLRTRAASAHHPTHAAVLTSLLPVFILLVQSIAPGNAAAQPDRPYFRHLTTNDGLAHGVVWSIVKDHRGFMWFGTENGLNRYDGRRFKVFRHSPDDSTSLSGQVARALCVDRTGTLWVGTFSGLNRYNSSEENFTRYPLPSEFSPNANVILALLEDRTGLIWMGTEHGGIIVFDPRNGRFVRPHSAPADSASIANDKIWTIHEDSKGDMWFGTVGKGLTRLSRATGTFTRYYPDPRDPGSIQEDRVPAIREDRSGAIWAGTYGAGLARLDNPHGPGQPVFTHFQHNPDDPTSISGNAIDAMIIDENDILWFGTAQGGLNRTIASVSDVPRPSFRSFPHDPLDPTTLLTNTTGCIYKDNAGLIWFADYQVGVSVFDSRRKPFRRLKHHPKNPDSPSNGTITTVHEDRSGTLWIGTWDGGLDAWDRTTGRFTHYDHVVGDPQSLSEGRVYSFAEDKSGVIWVGTYNGGLNRFDRETKTFQAFRHDRTDSTSIREDCIRSIAGDGSGRLWVGTGNRGLCTLDPGSKTFRLFHWGPGFATTGPPSDANLLHVDRTDAIWVVTNLAGVLLISPGRDSVRHYVHDPENPHSLGSNDVTAVFEDRTGAIWIGGGRGSLDRFDRETGRFERYGTGDWLSNEKVTGILDDDRGHLWLSTSNGLLRFDPRTKAHRRFDVDDGLLSNDLGRACRSSSGDMIIGAGAGVVIFHPDSIRENTDVPPVYITDFYLFNKPVPVGYDSTSGRTILPRSIAECDELTLNYDDKVFSFGFAALDFRAPTKNRYAYMMEGFDKDWTHTDAGRSLVTYTNLDPGEYLFRVKGSNNDGVWNASGVSLRLTILPPWWRTSWAYALLALLVTGTLFAAWRMQLRRIRIRNEYERSRFEAQKLHEVDELKTRFFTNISHEFRTPLTLILGPAQQLLESSRDEKTSAAANVIRRNAKKLERLVGELLDISRIEAGEMKLNASPLNVVEVIREITLSFHPHAERKRISLSFESGQQEITAYLDRGKAEKIVSNVLSNAFKFTPRGGSIVVRVTPRAGRPGEGPRAVEIAVHDTGIGIPADKLGRVFDRFYQVDASHIREGEGTGIGLALSKELMDLHKGRIEVESEEGKGSVFRLLFPLGKEHLSPEEIIEGGTPHVKAADSHVEVDTDGPVGGDGEQQREVSPLEVTGQPLTGDPAVLIVEDSAELRQYLRSLLEGTYRVSEAADGQEGLERACDLMPDLIISDIMMPKMDGLDLCRRLKEDLRTSHIPLVLLTAKGTLQDKLNGLDIGADDYVMKPFEAAELKARIRNLLLQRKRLQEHFRVHGFDDPGAGVPTSVDRKFLDRAMAVLRAHISDPQFGVEAFAREMAISKSLLFKKLHGLLGESPGQLTRRVRLNHAAKLIEGRAGNMAEIAFEVGFSNPSYFAEAFRKHFGVVPSQYKRPEGPSQPQ